MLRGLASAWIGRCWTTHRQAGQDTIQPTLLFPSLCLSKQMSSSSRAPSPKAHPAPSPRTPRLSLGAIKIGGRRIRSRTWLLAALLVGLFFYYYVKDSSSSMGSSALLPWNWSVGLPFAGSRTTKKTRPKIEEVEPVAEEDWLDFVKTGEVSEDAQARLKPPKETKWRTVGVDAIRRAHGLPVDDDICRRAKWWNPFTWYRLFVCSRTHSHSSTADLSDDFSLIDKSWTSSHLHPFPDSDSLSEIDIDRDLADSSPADDDPDATEPSWLDWRKLDEAMIEEETMAPIVGAIRPDMKDPITRDVVRETAKWRKLKMGDEHRLAALTGLVPPDPEKALSELGKNDFKELGRRMREFFALRRRHAEVWTHLRDKHGITDPWAWRPNHPSSPMPPFPKPDKLTGPLPDDPSNPTSLNNPARKQPYVHPELTPRMLDYARWFLRSYEHLLFAFLHPTFPSLSALHRSTRKGGRGIIMSAGDPQLRAAMTSVRTIREKLGSRLPIEIWYSGTGDLSDWGASRFKRWGDVTVRDIRHLFDHSVADLGGWHIKPFACLGSAFREIIFFDADVYFMQPPDNFFYHPKYLETGALFFRDRHNLFPDSRGHGDWLRSVMPHPPSETLREHKMYQGKGQHDMESGVMVIDRWRHMEGLLGAAKLISKEWREGAGKWALGDKELFWFGWVGGVCAGNRVLGD